MKLFLKLLILCVITRCDVNGQSSKERSLRKVFDKLVSAYGSVKEPPDLIFNKRTNGDKFLARYFSEPFPSVKVDEQVIDICFKIGKDSLDALAFIVSHELAHYYGDHDWCSDYAFALRKTELGKKLNSISINDKLAKETYADSKGMFYAVIAGFSPFGSFNPVIDEIYREYQLESNLPGYPSKEERKNICAAELRKMNRFFPLFKSAISLYQQKQYSQASEAFLRLNQQFPSREMYNNAGCAELMMAIDIKPLQAKEFLFPVELDTVTRLDVLRVRGTSSPDSVAALNRYLQNSIKQFEKALALDRDYLLARVNLATAFVLSKSPESALGVLSQVSEERNSFFPTILMLRAIAYYYSDNNKRLKELLKEWQRQFPEFSPYNYNLLQSENFHEN